MENTLTQEEKPNTSEFLNGVIKTSKAAGVLQTDEISDGYHTFGELYEFRKLYNAALFNEWAAQGKYEVHKSWHHHDEPGCFGELGKWFIVVAILPTGQISNHYKAEDWDLFKIPEVPKAKYPFDGHTPQDVLERLRGL